MSCIPSKRYMESNLPKVYRMSHFKSHEIDYLNSAEVGRLATVAGDDTVQNSPVGFTFNTELDTIERLPHVEKSKVSQHCGQPHRGLRRRRHRIT